MAKLASAYCVERSAGGASELYEGTEGRNAGSVRECTANSAAGVGETPNSRAQPKTGYFKSILILRRDKHDHLGIPIMKYHILGLKQQ